MYMLQLVHMSVHVDMMPHRPKCFGMLSRHTTCILHAQLAFFAWKGDVQWGAIS